MRSLFPLILVTTTALAGAAGADALFDVFATLPGLDMAAVLAAMEPEPETGGTALALAGEQRVLWQRAGRGMTRA